ncbi:MAG TPA: hypothetical protein VGH98_09845 [Gemmatimonadaceae bacterium]
MTEHSRDKSEPSALNNDPEAQLGGADSVEKTTYVVGKGTDPSARSGGPSATVPSRGAPFVVAVVLVALMLLVALAYLLGVVR